MVDFLEFEITGLFSKPAPLEQVVQISKPPRDETKASDAKQSIQDLGVDFDPDATRGVDVVAGRMAHSRSRVAEEEEKHTAPGDNWLNR